MSSKRKIDQSFRTAGAAVAQDTTTQGMTTQDTTTHFVHMHITWSGADPTEFRWGNASFIALQRVLDMPNVGPIVEAKQARAGNKIWVVRLDTSDMYPTDEDTRSCVGIPITEESNDKIIDEVIYASGAFGEDDTPKSVHIVGSLVVHIAM